MSTKYRGSGFEFVHSHRTRLKPCGRCGRNALPANTRRRVATFGGPVDGRPPCGPPFGRTFAGHLPFWGKIRQCSRLRTDDAKKRAKAALSLKFVRNLSEKTLEARVGIEPTNKGFADPGLTTWLPRRSSSLLRTIARAAVPSQSWVTGRRTCEGCSAS